MSAVTFFFFFFRFCSCRLLRNFTVATSQTDQIRDCSEKFYCPPPGSFLFSQPAELEQWCQSVPLEQDLPLTPPDTASDCGNSDCPSMTSQSWSHASYPEDSWSTYFVQDTGAHSQSYGSDWRGNVAPATSQDKTALDASAWMNIPSGTVDLGLSPVLSHESQSSHTLNSFSELDIPVLPPSLDLSFAEATWNPPAPSRYESSPQDGSPAMSRVHCVSAAPSAQAFHDPRPSGGLPLAQQYHTPVDYQAYPAQGTQDPQAFYQQPTLYYPPVTHHRPLLPRTEPAAVPNQATHGPQRAIRPHVSVPQGSDASVHSVSTVAGRNQDMPRQSLAPTPGLHQSGSPVSQRLPSGVPASGETTSHMPPDFAVHSQPVGPVGYLSDRTEDWTSFIHFDHEDTVPPSGPTRSESPPPSLKRHRTDPVFSYPTGYGHAPTILDVPPMPDVNAVDSSFLQDSTTATYGMPIAAPAPAETDEGRHRSHPLYNEGPSADGLYHCPYEKEPHCQHKPTKLKCNYEYELADTLQHRSPDHLLTRFPPIVNSSTHILSHSAARSRRALSKNFRLRPAYSAMRGKPTGCMDMATVLTCATIPAASVASQETAFHGGITCSTT